MSEKTYRIPGKGLRFDRPVRVIVPWPDYLGEYDENLPQDTLLAWVKDNLECPPDVSIASVSSRYSRSRGAALVVAIDRGAPLDQDIKPRELVAIAIGGMTDPKSKRAAYEAARSASKVLLSFVPGGTLTERIRRSADLVRETIIESALRSASGNRSKAARALGVTDERIATALRLYPWLAEQWPAKHGRPPKKRTGGRR